jgi:hypothetical protein
MRKTIATHAATDSSTGDSGGDGINAKTQSGQTIGKFKKAPYIGVGANTAVKCIALDDYKKPLTSKKIVPVLFKLRLTGDVDQPPALRNLANPPHHHRAPAQPCQARNHDPSLSPGEQVPTRRAKRSSFTKRPSSQKTGKKYGG